MVRLLRHRQTKGAETDTPDLTFSAPHPYSTAEDGERFDASGPLNRARNRRIFAQRPMCSDVVVIASVESQDSAKMRLAKNDEMIQALAADRPDQPFGKTILPR